MTKRYPPIVPNTPHMLHGGDYNPDQWVNFPEVWDQDAQLMPEANCNAVSLGIFAWVALEPEEGRFTFDWMDSIVEKLEKRKIVINFATPGGAKPAWMAQKYPEVLRVDEKRQRQLWGGRHNHCYTSPVWREKAQIINTKLAERYGNYPYFGVWHVNNEYGGECHCDLCQQAFREFLKVKYDNDLDKLNDAWWCRFWSHTITDWSQIESPSPIGEWQVHGQNIDWRRFVTHQTIDCFKAECEPLKRITPNIPVTSNLMTAISELDYKALARATDIVSWDSYPSYHDRQEDWDHVMNISFIHEQRRAMKKRPFMLMECAPGAQNYKPVCKLKRPGVHILEGLQAVANGADTVMYFQWRKGKGGFEKFHGAVVDHYPTTETRIFQEVKELGRILGQLDDVVGTTTDVETALIYDYQNRWAIDEAAGPRNMGKDYIETCYEHYRPFWQAGVPVDIIDCEDDFSDYKLLIAPMLYMIRPGVAEKLEAFVEQGGTLVTTYFSGIVNETDLCFDNGFPGPLRKLLGIWAEETDTLYDDESVPVVFQNNNQAKVEGTYQGGYFCDIVHTDTAETVATYGGEFYKDTPAVTVNQFGKGKAYYIASRNDRAFHDAFSGQLITDLKLNKALGEIRLPDRVMAAKRTDGQQDYIFILSFNSQPSSLDLGTQSFTNVLTGETCSGKISIEGYGHFILSASPQKQSNP